METHVKILAILKIVFGSLGILAALVIFLVFGLAAGVIQSEAGHNREAELGASIMVGVGIFIIFFLLLLSIPDIIAGYGLFQHAEWARILAIVLAIFDLIAFPIGTALGVYGLWVLFNEETVAMFKRGPTPPA
jgi:hypothetical protein